MTWWSIPADVDVGTPGRPLRSGDRVTTRREMTFHDPATGSFYRVPPGCPGEVVAPEPWQERQIKLWHSFIVEKQGLEEAGRFERERRLWPTRYYVISLRGSWRYLQRHDVCLPEEAAGTA